METDDTKVLSVRMTTELYKKLKKQSVKDIRSMSQQVVFYIMESLTAYKSSPQEEGDTKPQTPASDGEEERGATTAI